MGEREEVMNHTRGELWVAIGGQYIVLKLSISCNLTELNSRNSRLLRIPFSIWHVDMSAGQLTTSSSSYGIEMTPIPPIEE